MNYISRIIDELNSIINAESIILNYPEHKTINNKVNLHYYHPEWCRYGKNSDCNLGDSLSPLVVKWLCKYYGIDFDASVEKKVNLYAIGSIIQMGYQNATIWGSGFAFELSPFRRWIHKNRELDIRCIRGPLTKATLSRMGYTCPSIFGDPAVLLPLIYSPKHQESKEYIIVPHFSVEEKVVEEFGRESVLSMNTKDYCYVIDKICASKIVISSSLHGIILAEAYGVPAVYFNDRPSRLNYKYADWYLATDRIFSDSYKNPRAALGDAGRIPSSSIIQNMQEMLISSFPKDLWR